MKLHEIKLTPTNVITAQQIIKISLFNNEPCFFPTSFGRSSDESEDFWELFSWWDSSDIEEYSFVGY
jgi:hypothetical protein